MPAGSWFTPDGMLAVKDMMNQRISYFRPDGEFLRSEPLEGMVMTSAVPEPPFLEVVDGEGEQIKGFGERKPVEDRRAGMLVNSVTIAGHRGQVAAAFRFADDIRIYDIKSGQVDMVITRELAFTPREPKLEMQTQDVGEGNVAVRATAAADPVTLDVVFAPDGSLWLLDSEYTNTARHCSVRWP